MVHKERNLKAYSQQGLCPFQGRINIRWSCKRIRNHIGLRYVPFFDGASEQASLFPLGKRTFSFDLCLESEIYRHLHLRERH